MEDLWDVWLIKDDAKRKKENAGKNLHNDEWARDEFFAESSWSPSCHFRTAVSMHDTVNISSVESVVSISTN